MNLLPPGSWTFCALVACLALSARALEIRNYSEAVNRRLLDFPGFVYGHPPYVNPAFSPDASKFLAVGWPEDPQDWTRQMALISPRHIIYATHYPLTLKWKINFLGSDGLQHAYGLESQVPLINAQGEQTDLMLVTLSEPVANVPGVKPFKYLNLASEADYIGRKLLACGSFVDAATTRLDGFTTLSNDPGLDTTRFAYFDFNRQAHNDTVHRCNVRSGDSGGPVFVMENNEPALLGTFSTGDDLTPDDKVNGPVFRSYVSSIPAYASTLDRMMEAKGYHLARFYPEATKLVSQTGAVGVLHQTKAGSVTIQTSNTGGAKAHNVAIKLTFSHAPSSVTGGGWICDAASPNVWNCRRGGIPAASTKTLLATWSSLPATASMQVTSLRTYDGGTDLTLIQTLALRKNNTSWIQSLDE